MLYRTSQTEDAGAVLPGTVGRRVATDIAVRAGIVIALVASCASLSAKKLLWHDELLAWPLVRDPSFTHMIRALAAPIDGTPPAFPAVAWMITRVVGLSAFSFRLASCLGLCVGAMALLGPLRRAFGWLPGTIGVLAAFCTSGLALRQNAEARCYGLLTGAVACAVVCAFKLAEVERPRPRALFANVVASAVLPLLHVFGFLYSAAAWMAAIAGRRRTLRSQLLVSSSFLVGWCAFLPWIPAAIRQADHTRPRWWMTPPGLSQLLEVYSCQIHFQLWLMALAVLALLAARPDATRAARPLETNGHAPTRVLACAAIALFLIPAGVWLESHAAKPLFTERFFTPTVVPWAITLAFWASKMIPADFAAGAWRRGALAWVAPRAMLAAMALWPLAYAGRPSHVAASDYPGYFDSRYGHPDLPIVVESPTEFLERWHYAARQDRYFYLLDWDVALDPRTRAAAVQDFKLFVHRRSEYGDSQIVDADKFLETHPNFLFIDVPEYAFLERRLAGNPAYRLTRLGDVTDGRLFLVEKTDEASEVSR